jgi:hypothetical protein
VIRADVVRRSEGGPRAALALLFVLFAAVAAVAEEEFPGPPFPRGTVVGAEPPFYMPLSDGPAVARTWVAGMIAGARSVPGTRVGGDMLYAAAETTSAVLDDADGATSLLAEAARSYPAGDPTAGLAHLEIARHEIVRGHFEAAAGATKAARAWAEARWPARMDDADRQRWTLVVEFLERDLPRLEADMDEANGRHLEAAQRLESLADSASADPEARVSLRGRAARLYARGGDRRAALRLADAILEVVRDGPAHVHWTLWRLYCRHGRLAANGAVGLGGARGTDGFYDELLRTARDLSGQRGVVEAYLAMGSDAFVGERRDVAVEIYGLALRDAEFTEIARRRPDVWRGLLPAFVAAVEMGRVEDAERILEAIERVADEPIEEIDQHRAALAKARAKKLALARSKPPPSTDGSAAEPEPATPLGRLETGARTRPEDIDDAPSPSPAPVGPAALWPWLVVALFILVTLFVLTRRRRRGSIRG